jgi:hypothetical protein
MAVHNTPYIQVCPLTLQYLEFLISSTAWQDGAGSRIGFNAGIPWVGVSHTVPVLGTGTYLPMKFAVCHETRGTLGTHGFFSLKYSKYIVNTL